MPRMVVELHAESTGAGPALLLLHAFPLSARMWDDVRPALSQAGRLITPDLRGFGGSPVAGAEQTPSLDAMADDVAALLDRLGLDRVVLGGLSMGGYVAMAFLRRHRDRVRALVLADTKAGADSAAARDNRERIARTVLAEGSPRVLVDDVLPGLLGDTTKRERPAVVERVRRLIEAAPPAAVAWAQRAMAARPDSTQTLAHTHVPALVVVGAEDTLSTAADAQTMARALTDARVVVVPGAGHLTAVETPADFAAAVGEFLRLVHARNQDLPHQEHAGGGHRDRE
jgi:pimeloyl-ACP methyl ester carboxylesterase